MSEMVVGIAVHAEPEQLAATIESLRANTALPYSLVLLPDGPDAPTSLALARDWHDIPQFTTVEARGNAACFNRLLKNTEAPIVVFLESGARVAPHWIDRLIAALDADPANGLAGPSTNRCWNEQGVFPYAEASPGALERSAAEALERFSSAHRTLAPLYSLNDFCYVVRRQVFDAIGDADESYGVGPCWEMDYNVRAARAGFAGVWACSSFVFRAPFTGRRARDEARLFEANKRRYQDKFCGLRLRRAKSDYRQHCRGDACPNFAPRDSREPLVCLSAPASGHALVSCIMPTADRRAFVPRAIRHFLRQDYPNLELIVVDDGADAIRDLIPPDPRIVYERLPAKANVGSKRNIACARARGEFIVHWDDDDWYPPDRVSRQVSALTDRNADVCGTSVLYYYDCGHGRAYRYNYQGGPVWVAGNTLAYRRSLWHSRRFLDVQVGEDARFVMSSPIPAIADLRDPTLCIAAIHNGNVCPKYTSQAYWTPLETGTIVALAGGDLPGLDVPLISCIMPTYNRRPLVSLALRWFAQQSYPNRELLVVDDGNDPVADLAESVPNVRYLRLRSRTSIGAKRNLACEQAQGEILAQWDDDDWYSPERLATQAAPILEGRADVTGIENRYMLEMPAGRCWTVAPSLHRRMFVGDVHGGTLVYSRRILQDGIRYPSLNLAEDAALLQQALHRRWRLLRVDNSGIFVYLRHARNAWSFSTGKFIDPAGWKESEAPRDFPADAIDSYRQAVLSLRD